MGNTQGADGSKVAGRPGTALVGTKENLQKVLNAERVRDALVDAIPKSMASYITHERLVRILMHEVTKSPKLLECTTASVLGSLMSLVELALEPSSIAGKAYLVPYMNGRLGCREAKPLIGYRGYIELMYRSDRVLSVESAVMHVNDDCMVCLGDDPRIEHHPELEKPRGDWFAAYCVITMTGGGKHREVMSRAEIEAIRARSAKDATDAWRYHPTQMARKTVIRRAAHYVPMSHDLMRAIEIEDTDMPRPDVDAIIDATLDPVPAPTRADDLASKLEDEIAGDGGRPALSGHEEQAYQDMINDPRYEPEMDLSVVRGRTGS